MNLPGQLVYVTDSDPGITRQRKGKGFAYYHHSGELIRDSQIKERLNSLAVPPAYQDVWFCENPQGHLQATGVDNRNRKQYRYHEEWRRWKDQQKFDSLIEFGEVLPKIREAVRYHLGDDSFSKDRILAAVTRLLDKTAARVGNEKYYQENGTAGLTTLRNKHVDADGKRVQLSYMAKGGEDREFDLYQPTLSKIIDSLQDLPGQNLFKYQGRDGWVSVDSGMVNEWLKEKSGIEISAKDFRTWRASTLTLNFLLACDKADSQAEIIQQEKEALLTTSEQLGHRPPVCKKHYVHPEILKTHREGKLVDPGGSSDEERLMEFLKSHPVR